MIKDEQGYAISGATQEAANYYDRAVVSFNIYRGDPLADIDRAIQVAPKFSMAYLLKGHLLGLATEPALTSAARDIVRQVRTMPLSDREASHLHALELLLAGKWSSAADAWEVHNSRYPHDILALQAGHLIDFYRANARSLRDRPARVLPLWSLNMPGYSYVMGMYAFGLEEAGDFSRAEAAGRYAVELEPLDCWAHHAVAHVLEMQGRAHEGILWMKANEDHWSGDDNFFQGHNWWHYAVYLIELGEGGEALQLYDRHIGGTGSSVALDLVDASAMLWRLSLAGIDVGDRWTGVADRWEPHIDGRSYPFNDWHAVMANLGAGRSEKVESILQALRHGSDGNGEAEGWARDYGLPLSEGFAAFWRQDYKRAVQRLHPVRSIANAFGGSHAQRDIVDLTLIEAAIRAGDGGMARALANERCALKPDGRMNRSFLARSVELSAASVGVIQPSTALR